MIYAAGVGFFDFRTLLEQWASIGFFDVLLPFLIIFTVVFAILHKSKVLGDMQGINALIACIIAFFVVGNSYVTALFLPIFSQAGLALAILVAVMIIIGLFLKAEETPFGLKLFASMLGMGLFLWLLGRMSETWGIWLFPQDFFVTNAYWIIPISIFVLVIIAVVATTKKEERGKFMMPYGFSQGKSE